MPMPPADPTAPDTEARDASSPTLLAESGALLAQLAEQRTPPTEALAAVARLRRAWPAAAAELVWQRDPGSTEVHYDLLLRRGTGTISLAYAPDDAAPWPLRGAQRWADNELCRVGRTTVRVAEAVQLVDFLWNEAPITDRLIDSVLVRDELGREPIELDDDALQDAVDAWRAARGLRSAEATEEWLRQRGLELHHLERLAADDVTVAHLRHRLVGDRIATTFAAAAADYDVITASYLDLPHPGLAADLAARIDRGELDLAAAARIAAAQSPPRPQPHAVQHLRSFRRDLTARFAAPLPPPGHLTVVPPARLLSVDAIEPATLDAPTRDAIEQALFSDWLADRRRQVTIEWNWGSEPAPADDAG